MEPFAADRLEDNLNPVGRIYYNASSQICRPCSLAQEVGLGLGAQAGEARLRRVVTDGGFKRMRRASPRLAAARPAMIGNLDRLRPILEDLGGGLGVTDPVSGEAVLELNPR